MYTRAAVTLADLAARLGCRLEGDGSIEVVRVSGIEDAGPGDVTFLANSKYVAHLATTRASAIIVDGRGERLIVGMRDTAIPSGTSWLPLERIEGAVDLLGTQ